MSQRSLPSLFAAGTLATAAMFGCNGCTNNPYPPAESSANTHYINFGEDPKSLDPTFSFTTTESLVVDAVYPSFFRYHYLHQQPVRLIPNLGAGDAVRKPLPDGGEEWTFTIRRGLRFQDDPCFPDSKGRPITAHDFVYSFKRLADPKGEFPLAGILEDKIVGWKEYSAGFQTSRPGFADPQFDKPFPGVQVDPDDPFTFRIRLTQPYPQLRYLMAMHFTSPQAREAVEKYNDQYRFHPVGCGPYTLAIYTPKQRLVLRRNPNHSPRPYPDTGDPGDREAGLLDDAGKPMPLTDTIVLNLIRESTSTWNLFLQGYLDETALNSNNFQQAMAPGGQLSPRMRELGIRLRRTPQSAVYYLAFNLRDPAWGGLSTEKRKLRQAVALSLDANEYIDLAL
ncbi:MAG: ABC transporter substrate-binding protein, partial [Armatimonadaceae bacterium]